MQDMIFNPPTDVIAVTDIERETKNNGYFRKEIWTGEKMQITVMSIPVGSEIGLERHTDNEQMIYLETGFAAVYAGKERDRVEFIGRAKSGYAILIPAGTWHNVINEGNIPMKVFSVYAPPHHPKGTIHKTKLDSDLADY